MSKKEKFIEEISEIVENVRKTTGENPLSEDALVYFEALQMSEDKEKPEITEKGKDILIHIQDNISNYEKMFSAKQVAEGMGLVTRSVSASMRGLVAGGFLERVSDKPVLYAVTNKGREFKVKVD